MQRITTASLAPAAAVTNGVSTSQKPAAGAVQALTMTGSLVTAGVATFDIPRRLGITSDGNDSTNTFVITGTDRYGAPLVETLAGPNVGTVFTLNDFATVTSETIGANAVGNITTGTGGKVSSKWYPVDRYGSMELGLGVHQSGVANWTIEHAMEDPFTAGVGVQPAGGVPDFYLTPYPHPTLAAQSANASGTYTGPISAVRLTINTYTAGAVVTANFTPGFAGDS